MKSNIHPLQKQVLAQCVCNNEFYFYSSVEAEVIHIEVCNKCHPCATGKQQVVAVAGRVENFNNRFSNFRDKNLQASNAEAVATNKSSKVPHKSKISTKVVPKSNINNAAADKASKKKG